LPFTVSRLGAPFDSNSVRGEHRRLATRATRVKTEFLPSWRGGSGWSILQIGGVTDLRHRAALLALILASHRNRIVRAMKRARERHRDVACLAEWRRIERDPRAQEDEI
jgi:hypothetical protein